MVDNSKFLLHISTMIELDHAADCLDALGNPTRLMLYRLLVRAGVDGKAVGKLQEALDIPASTLTHHLKHLELVGLVKREKVGTTHMCRADYQEMDELILFLAENCCKDGKHPHQEEHVAHHIREGE
ncbi:ArsR/SmtB family transcription factor [Aestuariispira ectoiniformans]|uniref:ArsR/SmtB family transcription factor n=1 Tax=Aestuariispira ectoiniformans TaxID=2775080 RepID=UPI00223BE970|nr:metalloregulator ArsR/SmtB family transcription factor [Aestuariispira ectoiniformans]